MEPKYYPFRFGHGAFQKMFSNKIHDPQNLTKKTQKSMPRCFPCSMDESLSILRKWLLPLGEHLLSLPASCGIAGGAVEDGGEKDGCEQLWLGKASHGRFFKIMSNMSLDFFWGYSWVVPKIRVFTPNHQF